MSALVLYAEQFIRLLGGRTDPNFVLCDRGVAG